MPITFSSTNTATTFSHKSHLLTTDKHNVLLIPIHISLLYAFYRIPAYMYMNERNDCTPHITVTIVFLNTIMANERITSF